VSTTSSRAPSSPARSATVAILRAYQRWVSPAFGPRCRYYPSCSEYAVQAVQRFGILRGLVLAGWRLLRCNPLSHGGFDPVDEQHLFSPKPAPPTA
jgi:putative membrane protein insertion efficiency factor